MGGLISWKLVFNLSTRTEGERGRGQARAPSPPPLDKKQRRAERRNGMRAQKGLSAYRYDSVYTELIKQDGELLGQDVKCAQNTRTIKAGEMLEIHSFPAYQGRADFLRAKKFSPTSKEQAKINERNARRKFIRTLSANFTTKDYWGTFGWDFGQMPASIDEAKRQAGLFVNRINYALKKKGRPNLRYMYVIESEKGNPLKHEPETKYHLHIVMSRGLDRDVIEELWRGGQYPQVRNLRIKDFGGLTGLATYITKQADGKRRWGQSKGLKPWTRKPMDSYSKFTKSQVRRMAEAASRGESLKAVFEKAFPGYTYWDAYPAEVYKNEQFGGYYVYCRMYRNHGQPL